jgi:hypothetical protein
MLEVPQEILPVSAVKILLLRTHVERKRDMGSQRKEKDISHYCLNFSPCGFDRLLRLRTRVSLRRNCKVSRATARRNS